MVYLYLKSRLLTLDHARLTAVVYFFYPPNDTLLSEAWSQASSPRGNVIERTGWSTEILKRTPLEIQRSCFVGVVSIFFTPKRYNF